MGKDKGPQGSHHTHQNNHGNHAKDHVHPPKDQKGQQHAAGGGGPSGAESGHKAEATKKTVDASHAPKAKGHNPLPDRCFAVGCKAKSHRFNFCDEHFEHFKFGLIRKTGERVSDYEKKIEQYLGAQKASHSGPVRKAA